ncbi:MAG: hypothetical protein ACTHON_18420, partial [Humibacter sp.]
SDPEFEPTRPVTFATVRRNEYDASVPRITDRLTAQCTDLFNVGYEILVQILERYFAHTDETDDELATLAQATQLLMGGVLSPLGELITTLPLGSEHPGRNAGPSFEVFYQDDDLLPHRNSAWTLIEERLYVAAQLAERAAHNAPEDLATTLNTAQERLTGLAAKLESHRQQRDPEHPADQAHEQGDTATTDDTPATNSAFDTTIRPLFRQKDRDAMRFAFDLWSYDDVSAHADAILTRVSEGTMPCDGTWTPEQLTAFKDWIDAGKPA